MKEHLKCDGMTLEEESDKRSVPSGWCPKA